MSPELIVLPTADELARDVVTRLRAALADAQRRRGRAALALTAGAIMEQVWAVLASSGDGAESADGAESVDWANVDVFAADERFVPHDSPDRNDVAAERILFSHRPFAAASRYWAPASDGDFGDDLDAAATGYAATLYRARRPDDPEVVPSFDVVLLGLGPDGHCCSLFPDHPSASDLSASVIPVRDSPKPPPLRFSLSFDGLNAAEEIWVIASGTAKAEAAAKALSGGIDRTRLPVAGAIGRTRTLWLLDQDAASQLPESAATTS